eukprot:4374930-Heterocapsa_arctica.AAC.1
MGAHQHAPARGSPELTAAVLIRVYHAEAEARARKGLRHGLREVGGYGRRIGRPAVQTRGSSQRTGERRHRAGLLHNCRRRDIGCRAPVPEELSPFLIAPQARGLPVSRSGYTHQRWKRGVVEGPG